MNLTDEEREWLCRAAKGSGEKIRDSSMFLSLYSPDFTKNPLCALQLGIAIMLDKPISIIAIKGQKIPDNLRKIAWHIEECEEKPGEFEKASARLIQKMAEKLETH